MAFGSETDEPTAARIIDLCIERGVNFFDTANVYNHGNSESILGKLVKRRRDRIVLATKVRMKMGEEAHEAGLSAHAILKNIDDSLRRLRTDYVDLYYLHMPDYAVPIEETLEAMDLLVRAGKVRYPAVSNYAAWQVCRILWLCDKNGYRPPPVSQPMYNLLARGIEQEYVPFCKDFGISLVVYNPLARGLLAGSQGRPPASSQPLNPDYQSAVDRYQHPAYFDAVEELRCVADRAGRSLISLSLNWLLHHTATDCVIIGATNIEQLEENLDAFDHGPLAPESIGACDTVWRNLRGTTPRYNR